MMITPKTSFEEIQALIDAGGLVEFAPGVYENAHFRLTKPVHLVGYGAVLGAGKRIVWHEDNGVLWCEAGTEKPVRVLCVNGGLRQRCRIPKTGYLTHESEFDVKWMSTTGGGWQRKPTYEELTTLKAKAGDLDGLTLDSAEATVVHSWDESLLTVKRVDGNVVTFAQPGGHPAGGFNVHDYCLWNVPEAFDEAGTFYHDVKAGRLYYRPLPGENSQTEAWLPAYRSVFYADEPLRDVEIEGFELTAVDTPRESAGFGAYAMTGAIDVGAVEDSALYHLTVRATGGYGIRTTGTVKNLHVHHCEITQTGAGGLRIGSKDDEGKSVIEDCRISRVGLYYASAIGIAAVNCHIRHNEVCHTSYSAINCAGDDYVVEKNLLHDCMETLNDGAAIYSFGTHRGVMRENLAYGIHPKNGHILRIAYYLDETAKNWLVERNVAVDCDFPNHNHMCGDHLYRENIFVNADGGLLITMHNPWYKNSYEGNVLSAGKEIVFSMTENAIEDFSGNFYHSGDGTLTHVVLDRYDEIGRRTMVVDESNARIEPLCFTSADRVFEACGLKIDLSDVGPRA